MWSRFRVQTVTIFMFALLIEQPRPRSCISHCLRRWSNDAVWLVFSLVPTTVYCVWYNRFLVVVTRIFFLGWCELTSRGQQKASSMPPNSLAAPFWAWRWPSSAARVLPGQCSVVPMSASSILLDVDKFCAGRVGDRSIASPFAGIGGSILYPNNPRLARLCFPILRVILRYYSVIAVLIELRVSPESVHIHVDTLITRWKLMFYCTLSQGNRALLRCLTNHLVLLSSECSEDSYTRSYILKMPWLFSKQPTPCPIMSISLHFAPFHSISLHFTQFTESTRFFLPHTRKPDSNSIFPWTAASTPWLILDVWQISSKW